MKLSIKDIGHTFPYRSHDLVGLFKETKTLSTFMRKLEEQAIIDPINYSRDDYVGDAFEYFIECLIHLHSATNIIGISSYRPILENDTGVDGVGINLEGKNSVIQIKYRRNTQKPLTANDDKLSNMFSAGDCTYNVSTIETEKAFIDELLSTNDINFALAKSLKRKLDNPKAKRHYIFTTAIGLHYYTENEMYRNNVRCYGYKDITKMVNRVNDFWGQMTNLAEEFEKEKVRLSELGLEQINR